MKIFLIRNGKITTVNPVAYWDHIRLVASEIEYCTDVDAVQEYINSWRQWVVVYDSELRCERQLTEEEDEQFEKVWDEYVDDIITVYRKMNAL